MHEWKHMLTCLHACMGNGARKESGQAWRELAGAVALCECAPAGNVCGPGWVSLSLTHSLSLTLTLSLSHTYTHTLSLFCARSRALPLSYGTILLGGEEEAARAVGQC